MDELQGRIWDVLCGLDGESVARLFTNYLGAQVLTRDFAIYILDEGYSDTYELGLEDDLDDYDEED